MKAMSKRYVGGVRNSSPAFAGLPFGSANKRLSGSGIQPSPKSPSATSDTRQTLYAIPLHAFRNEMLLNIRMFNL